MSSWGKQHPLQVQKENPCPWGVGRLRACCKEAEQELCPERQQLKRPSPGPSSRLRASPPTHLTASAEQGTIAHRRHPCRHHASCSAEPKREPPKALLVFKQGVFSGAGVFLPPRGCGWRRGCKFSNCLGDAARKRNRLILPSGNASISLKQQGNYPALRFSVSLSFHLTLETGDTLFRSEAVWELVHV